MGVRSSLARTVPRAPTSADEIEDLKRRAWLEKGCILIYPKEITDPWTRQAVINEATRLYGQRPEGS